MQWKEKFLAFAIVIVFYYLVSTIVSQIFGSSAFYFNNPPSLYPSIVFAIVGLIAIVLSLFLIKIESISAGIMFGGILVLITGVGMYYLISQTQLEKTAILVVAFIVLIAVGYFKFAKKATPPTLSKQA